MLILDQQKREEYYGAVKEKDSQYIGTFFLAVKTTGIFCIPTCRARTPKFENIEFYTQSKDALQSGYRPCKICKPTNHAYEPPEDIQKAIDLVNQNIFEKVSDYDLKQNGMQPEKIRRWFKKHHGMTFQAYQRMLRINSAFQELKKGKQVTDSAFDSGYNSLSGFGYTFKVLVGDSPKESKNKAVILITRITSPLGPMFICATDKGICLVEFTDRKMLETEFRDLQKKLNAVILQGENEHIKACKKQLKEYFEGKRRSFDLTLDLPGTPFQQSVWEELLNIPFGTTSTYQQMARRLGKETAVRAMANANGHNRVAIIVPCHRVIGKDGNLTGYGGGLQRKQWLLDHEKLSNK